MPSYSPFRTYYNKLFLLLIVTITGSAVVPRDLNPDQPYCATYFANT